ncbi:MAG: Na+/H+ antiporter NhaC family protein [Planctomycetota bacterium]
MSLSSNGRLGPIEAPRRRWRAAWIVALGLGAVGILLFALWMGAVDTGTTTPAAAAITPATRYGAWVLTPAVVTILLAIALRQVIPALSVGVVLAAIMLAPFPPDQTAYGRDLVGAVRLATEHYLVTAVADPGHVKVIVFSLLIGGMVGVIAANGGTGAVVNAIARWGTTRRRGQTATWAAGLLVFFDDYANAMIIGPAMRPVCDRLRISRAKLAYIVDSTAAPVASIALIGTWIGYEIGCIQAGLDQLATRPDFLADVGGYQAFVRSLPYRFYPILALVMVLLIALLDRDFGPMRRAEREALASRAADPTSTGATVAGRAWYAVVPVLILVVFTLTLLVLPGLRSIEWGTFTPPPGTPYVVAVLQRVLADADPFNPILYAALASLLAAGVLSLVTGALDLRQTVESTTESMSRLLPTIVILVLAWTVSATMKDLQLGEVAVGLLRSAGFDEPGRLRSLPACIFLAACVVSFATGTSWGTMGILGPAAVGIAAGLVPHLPPAEAQHVFYASVGAVLAGAVFGDHCSPISDTTVLSSLASGCSLEAHVWTQMPYAVVVAAVALLCGDVFVRYTDLEAWAGLLIGSGMLLVIVLAVGRRPVATGVPRKPERQTP